MAIRKAVIVLPFVFAAVVGITDPVHAYAHGCPAQGGCCTVGDSCVAISANSHIFMMFAVVGLGAVTMMAFYDRSGPGNRLGVIFNIFS